MNHKLKTWPKYFNEVIEGRKTFEIRNNDRDFKVNDSVELQEFIPCIECTDNLYLPSHECISCNGIGGQYTGRIISFIIGYITSFAQHSNNVVFTLVPVGRW